MSSFMIMVLLLLLKFASSNSTPDGFIFNEDTLKLDGAAKLDSKGLLTLSNASFSQQTGHAFYNNAVQFKNTNNGKNGNFTDLNLQSSDPMQVWVEYNGIDKQLNVTLSPIHVPKPDIPLLSLTLDLSPVILDSMYVGFSSGMLGVSTFHYILGWTFTVNGQSEPIDLPLPRLPKIRNQFEKIIWLKIFAFAFALGLPFIGFLVIAVMIIRALSNLRKEFVEVLEDWEVHGNILEAIDQSLGTEYVIEEAELVLKLGLLCSHAVAAARSSMSDVMKYLEGEAQLPGNLSEIIKSQDFGEASNGEDVPLISVPSVIITEPFISRGR
ncbi:L-type lectin-domain containing receptor kinase V.9 [Camellia lanceoleosa]|uniref:L-type lectin-domain containing receptor kinase V.9 n=1 Tax=Camellia lanceoleosa TaxID=1840588 RepID=A0ACC0G8J4_9ERIC|nr:L-type lectin-domain containing receptor kinase V.9 [Camellia lanceoleosa]